MNSKTVIGIIIALIGYNRYIKFIDFINRLKLELHVVSVNDDIATITLSVLNVLNIPYKIKRINFLLNNTQLVAFIDSCVIHKKIVKKSHIPIHTSLNKIGVTKEDLQNSELEFHFLLLGFRFKRKYKPTNKLQVDNNLQNNTSSCGCGCS